MSQQENKPLDIIQYLKDTKYNLSPLAGISDLPFRLICRRFGCPYAFAEMTDANAILRANDKTFRLLDTNTEDDPCGAQVVGSEIEAVVEASRICEEKGFDILNINCACPVPKVKRKGKGVALMNEPDKIGEMIRRVTEAIDLPVVIKIRSGFDDDSLTYRDVALAAQQGGAKAIFMHPRNAKSKYGSILRKEHLIELNEILNIPVFASGNALTARQAYDLRVSTNSAGVSIARGAMGQPWIFRDVAFLEESDQDPLPMSAEEICQVVLDHFHLFCDYAGEKTAIIRIYKHLGWYFQMVDNLGELMKEYRKVVHHRHEFSPFIESILEKGSFIQCDAQKNKEL